MLGKAPYGAEGFLAWQWPSYFWMSIVLSLKNEWSERKLKTGKWVKVLLISSRKEGRELKLKLKEREEKWEMANVTEN